MELAPVMEEDEWFTEFVSDYKGRGGEDIPHSYSEPLVKVGLEKTNHAPTVEQI